jgi:SAM-dependent methyltransferase
MSAEFKLYKRLKLPVWALELACCPVCKSKMSFQNEIRCLNKKCSTIFPVVDAIPVLLDPQKSIFSVDAFELDKRTYYKPLRNRFYEMVFSLAPKIGNNIKARENYRKLSELILRESKNPRGLVLGGGIVGKGMQPLLNSSIELIETDVDFGPRTMAIVDAHSIPFQDNSFDCVIVQAVLEHVIDPYSCVKEIHRVLKPQGFVYAETAFMQQVHGGRFDFTRFTRLGHRRLFARFQEIESGAVCGTGMALAWAYEYFLMSLVRSATLRKATRLFARFTAFWLKYFDYITIENPATLEGASGFYFIGQKSGPGLSDKDLVQVYGQ